MYLEDSSEGNIENFNGNLVWETITGISICIGQYPLREIFAINLKSCWSPVELMVYALYIMIVIFALLLSTFFCVSRHRRDLPTTTHRNSDGRPYSESSLFFPRWTNSTTEFISTFWHRQYERSRSIVLATEGAQVTIRNVFLRGRGFYVEADQLRS